MKVLGIDIGTQSAKAVIVEGARTRPSSEYTLGCVASAEVQFDEELPQYGTEGGVLHGLGDGEVVAPPHMWAKAILLLLWKLRKKHGEAGMKTIKCIACSGQQHGSVYWAEGGPRKIVEWMRKLVAKSCHPNSGSPLSNEEEDDERIFAVQLSPVWMDSSTASLCRELEACVGGAQKLADLTGSRAYERFTGVQIAKLMRMRPTSMAACERISLVSSFCACVLSGSYAPIDFSDASGMNMMSIRTREWCNEVLEFIVKDSPIDVSTLRRQLDASLPSHTTFSFLHPLYCKRPFGLSPDCRVVVGAGDNPNSLAGCLLEADDVCISLGTSDTVFARVAADQCTPSGEEGHVFVDPMDSSSFMALTCHSNGGLTRAYIRDLFAEGSWTLFNKALENTSAGNQGCMSVCYHTPEITPRSQRGYWRFNERGESVQRFSGAFQEIRAFLEGQVLARRLHAFRLGIRCTSKTRVIVTGGASANHSILKVIASVFGCPVYVQDYQNSAALGAAFRAAHAVCCRERGSFVPFQDAISTNSAPLRHVASPAPDERAVYDASLQRLAEYEAKLLGR